MDGWIDSFIHFYATRIEVGVCVRFLFPVDCRDSGALTFLVTEGPGAGEREKSNWDTVDI